MVPRLSVGVFSDPRYVIVSNGPADNVRATLQQLGHNARPFINLLSAVTNDVLVFPEFGNRDLTPDLDTNSLALLRAYVAGGGLILVQGGYANVYFLSTVFGFSLSANGCFTDIGFNRTPQATGTPFVDAPLSIPANYCTYTMSLGSWPAGSLPLYTNNFYGSTVTLIPYGAGSVLHMGWNWNDAAPIGSQDSGWSRVLASAVQSRGVCAPLSVANSPARRVGLALPRRWQQSRRLAESQFQRRAWASGPAQLGYGDGDEATVVNFGSDPQNKFITTYFRRAFVVADAAKVTNVFLRLLRDDGAAVYLNGVEIVRNCLVDGAAFNTFASCTISGADENLWSSYSLIHSSWRSLTSGGRDSSGQSHQHRHQLRS